MNDFDSNKYPLTIEETNFCVEVAHKISSARLRRRAVTSLVEVDNKTIRILRKILLDGKRVKNKKKKERHERTR